MAADWMLGSVSPNKVVHAPTCRFARRPYEWARKQGDAEQLAKVLVETGGWLWHRPCRLCARDLLYELANELRRAEVR